MAGLSDLLAEAERQLTICNACRYCEGYCAVFPALERRLVLTQGDVAYLANLCHDCRACYQACMYTPPHDFGIDIPRILSEVRTKSYEDSARPRPLATLFRHSGAAVAGTTALGLILALAAVGVAGNLGGIGVTHSGAGSFYQVVPFTMMVIPALLVSAFVVAAMIAGFVLFWEAAGAGRRHLLSPQLWWRAAGDALRLRYLSGGGDGCYYPDDERPAESRRWLHALVFYGFASAFVATSLAALYQDLLGMLPPYPILSPPVLFGAAGGVAMIVGTTGLIYLKLRSERGLADPAMLTMDFAFLVMLDLVSITGMLLLSLRDTPLMGTLLVLHLAVLVGLYATAPYGKFVHVVYRVGALLLNRLEETTESP